MSQSPSPQSLATCALIALHSDPDENIYQKGRRKCPGARESVQGFLQECVTGIAGPTSAASAGDVSSPMIEASSDGLKEWIEKLKNLVGSSFEEYFVERLMVVSESIESLNDMIDSLRAAMDESMIDPQSSHGLYLRQICLGFDELSFEGANLLWLSFRDEVQCLKRSLNDIQPVRSLDSKEDISMASSSSFPATKHNPHLDDQSSHPGFSVSQMSRVLGDECLRQQQGESKQDFEEIESTVLKILEGDSEIPSAYFLRYINCLKHGERTGAFDALHQYFDYAMIRQQSAPQDLLQFASILLANTHSFFGSKELSTLATNEAVRVAQQSNDASCVAFSLGWLYLNGNADGELLRRCVERATENKLRPLVSGASRSLARHYLQREHTTPSTAWRSLLESTTDTSTESLVSQFRPTHLTQTTTETIQALASQHVVASGMCNILELPSLSRAFASTALLDYGKDLTDSESFTASKIIAQGSIFGSQINSSIRSNAFSTTEKNDSLCMYGKCISNLIDVKEQQGLNDSVQSEFLRFTMLVFHEWSVFRGELNHAMALGKAIAGRLHPRLENYEEILIDVKIQKCMLLARQNRWDEARALNAKLIEKCETSNYRTHHARLLLQLTVFRLEAGPEHGNAALSPLMKGITLCEKYHMDGLHATFISMLGKFFLAQENPKRAIALLNAALPSLLRQSHVWFQAEAYLTLGKAHASIATQDGSRVRRKPLQASSHYFQKSFEMFKICQDTTRLREVCSLKAHVFDFLGRTGERDEAAKQFVDISKFMNTCNSVSDIAIVDELGTADSIRSLASRKLPIDE